MTNIAERNIALINEADATEMLIKEVEVLTAKFDALNDSKVILEFNKNFQKVNRSLNKKWKILNTRRFCKDNFMHDLSELREYVSHCRLQATNQ